MDATNDVAYEAAVSALEARYAVMILSQARRLVRQHGSDEAGRDEACELLGSYLLSDEAWANVKATDISDIAYEAVNLAVDEQN